MVAKPQVAQRQLNTLDAPRRVAIVLNGNARAVTTGVVRSLRELLADPGSLYVSQSLEQGRFIARHIVNRGYDVVLSGGGDGTFCQIVSDVTALRPHRLPAFGVLRLGTGNALAQVLEASPATHEGLAADLQRAQRSRTTRPLNMLRVEGRLAPFAGAGLDALILSDYNATRRSLNSTPLGRVMLGGPGYALSIATRSLWRFTTQPWPEVTIRNDGAPTRRIDLQGRPTGPVMARGEILYRGPVAIAAASTIPFYGLGLRLFPQVEHSVDRFQLRVGHIGPLSVLTRLPALFAGTLDDPGIHDFLCTAVTIELTRPAPLQVGGDEIGDRSRIRIGMDRVPVISDRGCSRVTWGHT